MEAWLSVQGDDPMVGLEDLSDWLAQEHELRGLVVLRAVAPQPGQLGALAEVLVAAVGGGGAVSVLASSLKAFLAQPRNVGVRIVVSDPSGRRVEIVTHHPVDVDALIRSVPGQPK